MWHGDTAILTRLLSGIGTLVYFLLKCAIPKFGYFTKMGILLLIILCGVALLDKEQITIGSFGTLTRIDPLPHTQALCDQQRYAEAEEYLSFFMAYDYVNTDPEAVALYSAIEKTRSDYVYQLQKAVEGVAFGKSDELEGQVTAVVSDFLLIGDLRDLALEGHKWWEDQAVDELTVALSAIGVLASAATVASGGSSVAAKPALSFLKMAHKAGKVPTWLRRYVIESAQVVKNTKNMGHVTELLDTVYDLFKVSGVRGSLVLINQAEDLTSLKQLSKFAHKFENKTAVFFDLTGKSGLKLSHQLDSVPTAVALEASTFGKAGINQLDKLGPEKFVAWLRTAKYMARGTKVVYKHHEVLLATAMRLLRATLGALPAAVLGLMMMYGAALVIRR